ncbi:MAG: hypothetical protein IJV87_10245 [Clostridia bacterium]|nr:hypothetical protein [Clostridia bacterium]
MEFADSGIPHVGFVIRNEEVVYAKTREECEEKLAELIKTMKAEIAEMKKTAKNA